MIRVVGVHVLTPVDWTNKMMPPPKTRSDGQLRIFTGDDSRFVCDRDIAVLEIHFPNGRAYLTGAELRAFADLMDATPDY